MKKVGELLPKLDIFVIYGHPLDYPGEFVVRRSVITSTGVEVDRELFARAPTLEGVREALPPGLYCLARDPNDAPVIVESWL